MFMPRVYAKIRPAVHCFLVFSFALLLSACASTGSGYSRATPWNMPVDPGVVTNDPASVPDIAWQTQNQRRDMLRQDARFTQQQQQQSMMQDGDSAAPQDEGQAPVAAPPPAAASSRGIAVSLLVPLSGKNAELGQSMMKAAQMALFDVGGSGFQLVPRDTQSTPSGAAGAARAAAAAGDALILGPVFADDVKAVKPVATAAGIPVVAFTTDWTLSGNGTYIMGFLPFVQVARVAQFAKERGYDRIGFYAPQTEYADIALASLQKSGAHIVRSGRYAPTQPDLSALVADFAETSKTADGAYAFSALMLPIGGEGLRSLVSQLQLGGITNRNMKFLGTGLWDDVALTADPALYGGWFAAPDPALRRDFERRFQENYGTEPMRLASLAYDATALAAVLARTPHEGASPYDRAQMTNPRGFAGIDGVFRFRHDGLAERGLAVLEMQAGRPRVIDPAPTAFITPDGQ